MVSTDLYVKLSDPTGKHATIISHHRVWDGSLFMSSLRKQHETPKNPDDYRKVSQATEDDYRKFAGYKGY